MNTVTPTFTSCQADAGRLPFQVAADTLDEAWSWLCRSRENAPDHADIWALRHRWAQTRDALIAQLVSGEYRLTPMLITGRGRKKKEAQALWSARDALVLKWVALIIAPQLAIPARCEHVKGHGGGPSSVARMTRSLVEHRWRWVCRTDVRGYYGSMNKQKLLACVFRQIQQPVLRDLITQYVHYTVEYGGEFHTPEKGIARGCALSPMMGALYLAQMDTYFSEQAGMYYARYMDDVVILAKTRWQLRRYVRALNQFFNAGDVEQHPDKTFIGRTTRGFDWMGAQMGEHGVEGIAQRAKVSHRERLRRLYERFSSRPAEGRMRMSAYRRRWKIWAMAMIAGGLTASVATASMTISGNAASGFPAGITAGVATTGTFTASAMTNAPGTEETSTSFWGSTPNFLPLLWLPIQVYSENLKKYFDPLTVSVSGPGCQLSLRNRRTVTMSIAGTYSRPYASQYPTLYIGPTVNVGYPHWENNSGRFAIPTSDGFRTAQRQYQQPGDVMSITGGCKPTISLTYGPFSAGDSLWVLGQNGGWGIGLDNKVPLLWNTLKLSNPNGSLIPVGTPPTCTSLVANQISVDLGGGRKLAYDGGAADTKLNLPSVTTKLNLSCTGDAKYPVAAVATVYGSTSNELVSTDPTKILFNDPGLYLKLTAPNSWPVGVSPANGQNAGTALMIGTATAPLALWSWSLPGTTTFTTNAVDLSPAVYLTGKTWSTDYGKKQVTIRFTTTVQ